MGTLELKCYLLRDRICAWEFTDPAGVVESGMARPYKRLTSLDKMHPSEYFNSPYTKKQVKAAPFIGTFSETFVAAFLGSDTILPAANYLNAFKQTFGENSRVYELYVEKSEKPSPAAQPAELFIDFEAMDMVICGWYAVLVDGDHTETFSGIAKPFNDDRRIKRKYKSVYAELLPYTLEEILEAQHISHFQSYFINIFRQAKKIYTYGDTDALFIKHSFGEHIYNFFKVRNVDVSVKLGNRALSLDKTCHLFGIEIPGHQHDPRIDVEKMMAYIEATKSL